MMQAAIIAGGLGTRIQPLTAKIPKSMVVINGRPFIDYQLELMKGKGIEKVVLCLGNMHEKIIAHCGDGSRYGLEIRYSIEHEPLGTAGAIKNAEKLLEDIFFIMYGDSYLTTNFKEVLEYFKRKDNLALNAVYKNNNRIEPSNISVKNGFVVAYDKNNNSNFKYIDYGLSIFRKEVLLLMNKRKMSLEELFKKLIGRKELLAFEVKERFYEIGSLVGICEFEGYLNSIRIKEAAGGL